MTADRVGAVRLALADLDLTDPRSAFAYGLALGAALEREQQDAADDLVHRAAVRRIARGIERADRRARADAGCPT